MAACREQTVEIALGPKGAFETGNIGALARRDGITRARVTQVMGMLRLSPEIQQRILSLPEGIYRPAIGERAFRPQTTRPDR